MPRCYEFYFADLDTLVLVESSPDDVTVRVTRNTFSDRRKRCFIHELVAEGFIPESYAWVSVGGSGFSPEVRWLVDLSWLKGQLPDAAVSRRFMLRAFAGATVLWIVLMSGLLLPPTGWGWLSRSPAANSPTVSHLPCPPSGPTPTNCWLR